MSLDITMLPLGPLQTNCYVLRNGGQCWVIDPGMWPEPLVELLRREDAAPTAVLLTHGHGDHVGGVDALRKAFPDVKVICPAADAAMLGDAQLNLSAPFGMAVTAGAADATVEPGAELQLGQTRWAVLDTSGHTPGGVSYYCAEEGVLVTGDALFASSIGRTDIPGGDGQRLVRNLREHLLTLPDETRVLPGHGDETTIGRERRLNPFLL